MCFCFFRSWDDSKMIYSYRVQSIYNELYRYLIYLWTLDSNILRIYIWLYMYIIQIQLQISSHKPYPMDPSAFWKEVFGLWFRPWIHMVYIHLQFIDIYIHMILHVTICRTVSITTNMYIYIYYTFIPMKSYVYIYILYT